MSMLDAFFKKGFNGPKCKTLLKLTIPRIKLLRNKREIQLKQMRKDIAKLLENGQEATARIRVEHIIREENMMAAQEIIELFCELIAVRLPIIETQRECPLDLKEAISSICFAAPRCSDLTELQQVQMLFAAKYGREFVAAATELMPDCGVNRQIIELLSVRAPSVEAKLKLLKEIAEEHEVDWDPAESEAELLKPHEDLLNGPSHIISGSTMPLPKEKHDDSISSEHKEEHHEEADSDAGFDSLDLPEVPKASVRTTSEIPSAPEINPSSAEDFSPHPFDTDSKLSKSKPSKNIEVEVSDPETLNRTRESKQFQFIPFVSSPPPPPLVMLPLERSDPAPVLPRDPTPSSFVASPPHPPVSLPSKHSDPAPFVFHDPTPLHASKTEANVDFQDVLVAAQAAAESADRAAAAARAAARLAQVRIAEMITKKSSSSDRDGWVEGSETKDFAGKPTFDQQNTFVNTDHIPHYEPVCDMGSPTLSTDDVREMRDASPDAKDYSHQMQRSVSIEEDPYFSYPNLFTRQDSGVKPGSHPSDEHSRSSHGF